MACYNAKKSSPHDIKFVGLPTQHSFSTGGDCNVPDCHLSMENKNFPPTEQLLLLWFINAASVQRESRGSSSRLCCLLFLWEMGCGL